MKNEVFTAFKFKTIIFIGLCRTLLEGWTSRVHSYRIKQIVITWRFSTHETKIFTLLPITRKGLEIFIECRM